METEKGFAMNSDRYQYDFSTCTTQKGFAQVDTSQDAWYYGTWANPATLTTVNYCEGNITIRKAASRTEFVEEMRGIQKWNNEDGRKFLGIDPGFNAELKAQFVEMGLADMLHGAK